jgi:MFS family permease
VGEATLSPATYSLLADLFPRHRMGWAISLFNCGVYLGSGAALLLGGSVVAYVQHGGTIALPLLGELKPWQFTFVFVGLLGLPFVLLLGLFREPVRQAAPKESTSFTALFRHIGAHRRFVLCFFGGMVVISLAGYSFLSWSPTVFVRVHQWPLHQVGTIIGSIVLVVGTGANLIGARLAEAYDRRGVKDGIMRLMCYGAAGVALAGLLLAHPNPYVALAGFTLVLFFSGMPLGIAHAALQLTTPSRMRAKLTAVFTFFNNMLGLAAGPTIVATLTEHVYGDPLSVGKSIATIGLIAAGSASLLFFIARTPYRLALESQDPGAAVIAGTPEAAAAAAVQGVSS